MVRETKEEGRERQADVSKEDLRLGSFESSFRFFLILSWPVSVFRFLLHFEHFVPSSECGCSFFSFLYLLVFVYSSESRKEGSAPPNE